MMDGNGKQAGSGPAVYGLQKLSLVDWPGGLAATVFTGGCDLRCPFCYNASLVEYEKYKTEKIDLDTVFSFLEERKGLLDAVVLSGGEPLMQPGVEEFAERVRDMGFIFKLDTNGTYPKRLAALIDAGLVDYVAMDIKNSPEKYARTAGLPVINISDISESIEVLEKSGIDHEFRTTVVRQFHTPRDLLQIAEWLRGASKYFIQKFTDPGALVGDMKLTSYSDEEMQGLKNMLEPYFDEVAVRGADV